MTKTHTQMITKDAGMAAGDKILGRTRRIVGGGIVAMATLAMLAGPASANDCFNISRNSAPTPNCTATPTGGCTQGLWTNNGFGWGKTMPGTEGANGNYTNGRSFEQGGMGAINGVGFCSGPNRNIESGLMALHGIQVPGACWGG